MILGHCFGRMFGLVIVLNTQFLDLFRMTHFKVVTVHQMISWYGDQIHWDLSLLRSPNDWKEENACNLFAKLVDMEVMPQGNDELVWSHDPKGLSISRVFVMLFMIGQVF